MAIVNQKIDAWWTEFQARAKDLEDLFSRRQRWNLPAWMQKHLQGIHPKLMWEFGPAVEQSGHRLVITPECRRELRPLVKTILERAPCLPGWEFYAYRLPESFEQAKLAVKGRTDGDIVDTSFEATIGELNQAGCGSAHCGCPRGVAVPAVF